MSNYMYVKAVTVEEMIARLTNVANSLSSLYFDNLMIQGQLSRMVTVSGGPKAWAENKTFSSFVEFAAGKQDMLCTMTSLYVSDGTGMSITVKYQWTDGIWGQFSFEDHNNNGSIRAPFLDQLREALNEQFKFVPTPALLSGLVGKADSAAMQIREQAVNDLSGSLAKLQKLLGQITIDAANNRQELERELRKAFADRTDELERVFRERQANLADDELRYKREHQQRIDEVAEREKLFDMRESRGVRRNLEKKIDELLMKNETMALSKGTGDKRWGVHAAVWGLLSFSGFIALYSASRILNSSSDVSTGWHIIAPMSGGIITFVLTMIYYVKWNDRWFREHADAELAAKRYKVDMVRSAWVAELVQEYQKEGKGDLPEELLTAVTANLFRDIGPSRPSDHPVDNLTSLLRRATDVSLSRNRFSFRQLRPIASKSKP
ncbi:MAG: hypothetical protein ACK54T_08210 [bacterium]|jgi:hypothetical protein